MLGQTRYSWNWKYGGMNASKATRLKALEEENHRLKRFVADQALIIRVLKDVLGMNGDYRAVARRGQLCREQRRARNTGRRYAW